MPSERNFETSGFYAVVLGNWHFNSLGIVRSLGEQGVPVVSVNFSESGYADSSRYAQKVYHVKDHAQAMEVLRDIAGAAQGRGVLFPCSDQTALFLDENRSALEESFIVPHAGGNMGKWMQKDEMCAAAGRAGYNVPESRVLTAEDFAGLEKLPLPLIVKPLASVEGNKADIRVCWDGDAAKQIAKELGESGYTRILAQTFLHGEKEQTVGYCGCKTRGAPVELYGQVEKIREYPAERGSASYAQIVPEVQYIDTEVLDRFLEETGFEGLFDLDIKVIDGTPWFIEINFRNGAYSYAFTAAGCNIPYTWFCAQTGQTLPERSIRQVRLMSERDDLNYVLDKQMSPFRWLRDLRKTDVCMIFNRRDREPFRAAYNKIAEFALACAGRRLR